MPLSSGSFSLLFNLESELRVFIRKEVYIGLNRLILRKWLRIKFIVPLIIEWLTKTGRPP